MENRIIETKNGNRYFYSPLYRTISICENTEDDEYNRKKFQYLSEHFAFIEKAVVSWFSARNIVCLHIN